MADAILRRVLFLYGEEAGLRVPPPPRHWPNRSLQSPSPREPACRGLDARELREVRPDHLFKAWHPAGKPGVEILLRKDPELTQESGICKMPLALEHRRHRPIDPRQEPLVGVKSR